MVGLLLGLLGIKSRDKSFFELFEQRAQVAREAIGILSSICTSVEIQKTWDKEITEIEHRCDILTGKIIEKAEKQNLLAVSLDCEDVVALAKVFDDVIDSVEELVTKIVDYRMMPDARMRQFLCLVVEGISYISDCMFRMRDFADIADLREKMKDCEHRSDRLVRLVIQESDMINVVDILMKDMNDPVTVADLQSVLEDHYYRKRYRELAELAEKTVDDCKTVFHVASNIYMKEA